MAAKTATPPTPPVDRGGGALDALDDLLTRLVGTAPDTESRAWAEGLLAGESHCSEGR